MKILTKHECTRKSDALTDKWRCGCVKCVEDLTIAGWATNKTQK